MTKYLQIVFWLCTEQGIYDEADMLAELEAMGGEEFKFDAVARAQELT